MPRDALGREPLGTVPPQLCISVTVESRYTTVEAPFQEALFPVRREAYPRRELGRLKVLSP
jgi:hypothetical protein